VAYNRASPVGPVDDYVRGVQMERKIVRLVDESGMAVRVKRRN